MLTKIDQRAVTDAFVACGVRPGDCLMLHADAFVAAQMPTSSPSQGMDWLLDGVMDALAGGTLVMPTFTYSATKGEPFAPAITPSDVGRLTEHFRQRPGVLRSRHPIFSVAACGRWAEEFADSAIEDCFGPGTAFDLLMRHDAWLAALGCALDRVTFVHYVEQAHGVSYRYFKEFPFEIDLGGKKTSGTVRYFVRDIHRKTAVHLGRLKARLLAAGLLKVGAIGRAQLLCVRARDFLSEANALLDQQENALIEEGQEAVS